jgi:predicted chitinase
LSGNVKLRVDYAALRRLAPRGRASILRAIAVNAHVLERYGIMASRLRLCHFLAQAAHETDGFRTLVEYGSWSYFARRYGRRRDLGNHSLSDGPLYRGRGVFQLTGRANYRRFGRLLGFDLEADPALAARADISLMIAGLYWRRRGLNQLADRGRLKSITRRINGGLNGYSRRLAYLRRALAIWPPSRARLSGQLRRGDVGPGVRILQEALRRAGYRLRIDGIFGPRTQGALKRYQRRHGHYADRVAGPRTLASLDLVPILPHDSDLSHGEEGGRGRTGGEVSSPSASSPVTTKEKSLMEQWKAYLRSRTIWANIIGLVALILDLSGFAGISSEDQGQLVDSLLKIIEAGGFVLSVFFRAIARKRLGPTLF